MRIVCDTNVLVSGVLFPGNPRQILSMASRGSVTVCTSEALLREADEVLHRPKFGLRADQVAGMLALFRDTFETVHPSRRVSVVSRDPDDNRVLEAADAASAEVIVSGDKDLLELQAWHGIRILSPARFVEEARARPER